MDGLFGLLLTILLKVSVVSSSEAQYCTTDDGYKWCSHGCCDGGTRFIDGLFLKIHKCCEGTTVWMPVTYGGAGFIGLCLFIGFVCWYKQFMERRHGRGHGVAVRPAPVTVKAVQAPTQPAPVQTAHFPAGNYNNQVVNNFGPQPSAPPPAYPGPGGHQHSPFASDPVYPPPQSNFRRF